MTPPLSSLASPQTILQTISANPWSNAIRGRFSTQSNTWKLDNEKLEYNLIFSLKGSQIYKGEILIPLKRITVFELLNLFLAMTSYRIMIILLLPTKMGIICKHTFKRNLTICPKIGGRCVDPSNKVKHGTIAVKQIFSSLRSNCFVLCNKEYKIGFVLIYLIINSSSASRITVKEKQ